MSSFCASCHAPAIYVCERCNVEVYCSVECQRNSFPQHRFICFQLPALRRFNDNELMSIPTPQTPMVKTPNIANDFENLSIKSSTGSASAVADRKVEAKIEVVKPANEDEPKEKSSSGKLLAALTMPAKEVVKHVKEDKPIQQVVEAPKEVQQPAKTATPAFNQGQRSTPPSEMTKKLVIPVTKPARSVVAEESAFVAKDTVDTTMLRRNHQDAPRIKTPLQKPLKIQKAQKIFYSDLNVRELAPGQHKVNVMNAEPAKKMFYLLEAFEGIEEYCKWIESAIEEIIASNTITSYEPEIEEMILAKFEGNYYRAISTAKKGASFIVFFIDYGNIAEVAPTDIVPFSPKLQMEIILHEVVIENLSVPLSKKAKEILANPEGFEIEVKEGRTEMGSYIANLIGL